MLLDAGIDPHLVNAEGRSILYAAVYNQRHDILDWLLSKVSFEESDILRVDICHRTVIDVSNISFIYSSIYSIYRRLNFWNLNVMTL